MIAEEYGRHFYGERFMEEVEKRGYLNIPRGEIFDEMYKEAMEVGAFNNDGKAMHFFCNFREISKDEFENLSKQLEVLTSIRDARDPLGTKKVILGYNKPAGRK